MLYTPNNILYKYIRYRFRRIQIQCNMLYDIAPEEEDEICRNLLKKRAKILIPAGILYFLLLGIIFAWLVGISEELNPLMKWELRVIYNVIPILNIVEITWYAYSLDLLRAAVILMPLAIINSFPYIIIAYIVDTILIRREMKALLIRREMKALIKKYSIDDIQCG